MLSLCRDGRLAEAERLLASFRAFAATPGNGTAATMGPTAIPIAEAMLAYARRDYGVAIEKLAASRYRWPLVGASHAQRDVFTILLIAAAEKAGDWATARALLGERMQLRPHSAGTLAHYQAAMAAPLA